MNNINFLKSPELLPLLEESNSCKGNSSDFDDVLSKMIGKINNVNANSYDKIFPKPDVLKLPEAKFSLQASFDYTCLYNDLLAYEPRLLKLDSDLRDLGELVDILGEAVDCEITDSVCIDEITSFIGLKGKESLENFSTSLKLFEELLSFMNAKEDNNSEQDEALSDKSDFISETLSDSSRLVSEEMSDGTGLIKHNSDDFASADDPSCCINDEDNPNIAALYFSGFVKDELIGEDSSMLSKDVTIEDGYTDNYDKYIEELDNLSVKEKSPKDNDLSSLVFEEIDDTSNEFSPNTVDITPNAKQYVKNLGKDAFEKSYVAENKQDVLEPKYDGESRNARDDGNDFSSDGFTSFENSGQNLSSKSEFATQLTEVEVVLNDASTSETPQSLISTTFQRAPGALDEIRPEVKTALIDSFMLVDNIYDASNKGFSRLIVRITPEHFGKIEIKLSEFKGKIVAEIVAETKEVRTILANQADVIIKGLADKGISVENINLSFDDALDKREGRGQREKNKHKKNFFKDGDENGTNEEKNAGIVYA